MNFFRRFWLTTLGKAQKIRLRFSFRKAFLWFCFLPDGTTYELSDTAILLFIWFPLLVLASPILLPGRIIFYGFVVKAQRWLNG